jgi:excisionase family DNA binding protein
MTNENILPIREQLDRIEKKLEGKYSDPFLSIRQVADFTALSPSTIRRAMQRGHLKCSKSSGKLLFKKSDVVRWING